MPASRQDREPRASAALRQKNRMLALLLGGVAALVLVTAVSLVLLLHYAEAQHLLSSL